jgi:hypothetical protein
MPIVSRDFIKQYFNIEGEALDSRIDFFIPLVENDYLRVRNKAFDTDGAGNIVYPLGAGETAARMVMFKINTAQGVSVAADGKISAEQDAKSESWGDHSVTYKDGDGVNADGAIIAGYPKAIYDSIEKYVGFV